MNKSYKKMTRDELLQEFARSIEGLTPAETAKVAAFVELLSEGERRRQSQTNANLSV